MNNRLAATRNDESLRFMLAGKTLLDQRIEDSQAWRDLHSTDGWKVPRVATYAERESAASCVEQIETDRREEWDEPNLTFHRDSMRIGDWGDTSQIAFVASSISNHGLYQNANLWLLELSACEVITTEYDARTIDIELAGIHDGEKVRVGYNNPRSWGKEIKFDPHEKKIYKLAKMQVDEAVFVDSPSAFDCSDTLWEASQDQPIQLICDIKLDDLRVKSYYEYLAVYDFGKHALLKYESTPAKRRPRGQRVMNLQVGDALVSTHSRKFEGTERLPYPLELEHTFTTDYEAR